MATHKHNQPTARAAALAGAALLVTLAAGCQKGNNEKVIHGESFLADGEPRPVDRFVDVQSAAAARADATLNDVHFDGGSDLNSLGRAKLDLMLRDDDAAAPLVVYLDVPRDAARGEPGAHRDAVRAYLADRGLADGSVEFRGGPNPDYSHPAKDGLRGLKRLAAADAEAAPEEGAGPAAGALGDFTGGAGSK